MKLFRFVPVLLGFMGIVTFSGCTDDDDLPTSEVPSYVVNSFKQMYPNARAVDWERNMQFYVAEFSQNTFDNEAWYLPKGAWMMTETDYGSLVSMLPAEVQSAFYSSQYVDWIVDDAKYFERNGDSFSIIEVETDGMPEIALFYDSFGNLVNKVQGDDFDITPYTVITEITF